MTRFVSYNLFVFQKVNIMVACCFPYHSWQYITLYLGTDASHKPERKLHFLDNNFSAFQNPFRSKHHNGHRANCLSVCWSSPKFLRLLMVTAPFSPSCGVFIALSDGRMLKKNESWQYRKMQRPRGLLKPLLNIEKYGKLEAPTESNSSAPRNTAETTAIWAKLRKKMPSKSLRDVYPNSIASP